jgi:hypothetical protein
MKGQRRRPKSREQILGGLRVHFFSNPAGRSFRNRTGLLRKHLGLSAFAALAALLLAGCATLPPSNVESFATGVSATRNQTSLAFQAVTDLTSESIVDYAAAQATLTDTNFLPVLPPESVATWDAAFDGLQKYSQNLVVLTSPNLAGDYEDAVANLAAQVKQTGDVLSSQNLMSHEPSLSPSLAAAFTELSSLLLRAKARHDTRVILTRSDPTIRQILTTMAEAIGAARDSGLRGTVHAHWEQNKGKLKVAFVSTTKPEERHCLAAQYASLLASEVAQDQALASLQRSLLALADAHHALASGQNAGLATAIAAVEQEVQHTCDLANRFQRIAHGATSN